MKVQKQGVMVREAIGADALNDALGEAEANNYNPVKVTSQYDEEEHAFHYSVIFALMQKTEEKKATPTPAVSIE